MTLERVLITGGSGQLASDLKDLLAPRADVRAPGREELDVTDADAVEAACADLRPDTVFNCAAFHNIDVCEQEVDRSFEVNASAVKDLSERCRDLGAKFVHLSTNYVFDGCSQQPNREQDAPAPRSIYAISKLAGEYAALAYAPGALVVRTAGLYGLHGNVSKGGNFVTRMVARSHKQGFLKVVYDQRLQPTFTADLAEALIAAVEADAEGLLHLTSSDDCSWHDFAVEIMRLAGIDVPVEAIQTTTPPGGVDRPLNGVLAREAADAAGLRPLRSWREALADYMERAGLTAASQPS